ncbi:CLUMA_CG012829, isoform A [Clunio marinus]|uniref:CLUMA_CG012829, isoform A n=1 Tax=Clunio marinus TaxID=568069 RepID=A0A1J1IKA4_9DIPT|nr:CLUMA_CG012829, isoform A [Clunio marinus]
MLSKQQCKNSRARFTSDEDEIVISGIAGRFPNSNNVAEFEYNLYNKIDMVDDAETRWRHTFPDCPKRSGKLNNLNKFDTSFFGIHTTQADSLDPQCRTLLEHSYEAVLDAGINPKSLRGTRTGVYIGCCYCESEKFWIYDHINDGMGISGNSRALLANRISFFLGLQGPSITIDSACSSSMFALDAAFSALQSGECEAAFVGGANLLLHPFMTIQFMRLGVLAKNGYCRPFDVNANGFTRAEAINVLFLQKKRDAKRIYANIVYSKTNSDGFKNEGLHYPSGKMQANLLKEFYEDINIPPSSINYVEAHSTGTVVGDPEECDALEQVVCAGRDKPLLVGSVKSNMGHSEASSGLCSITKVIIAFENQTIPPNINFESPRRDISALVEGKLKVVDEIMKLEGPLVCINSFGFGGANAHALFKANPKEKVNRGVPNDNIPRLVVWSGRTEEAVSSILDSVRQKPLDAEYVALLQNCQIDSMPANIFRGYGVYVQKNGTENATCVSQEIQHYAGNRRPIVWVYSGMGSQWCGMGRELMQIPIFADAIDKCHEILAQRGLNLKEIITSDDPKMFDNILHSFVGIAAIQIGLTDILKTLGMEPDHIIGHSVGELGCAYADGCFTAEEMILSSYSRGMASIETKTVFGSMAAVGIGYNKLKTMIPDGIEIACHNSADSSTISGPAELISNFVAELVSKNIFAREVACSNIPFHSKYIAEMGPKLLSKLNEIIKKPVKRSSKWISSSFPNSRWNEEKSQYSSAIYHTNNLLSQVLFEEACSMLPTNGLIIEIAPHALLQAILKRSFPEAVNIPLTRRGHKRNDELFFDAIGKIYTNGFEFDLQAVYPKVDFPVSRGTPMISPKIKWDHRDDWFVSNYLNTQKEKSAERFVEINISDHKFTYIAGHSIDGRCLFPATGYIFLAWETFAITKGKQFTEMLVEFEDVKFLRATSLRKDTIVEFMIVIQPGTGSFEISEGSSTLVTGVVKEVKKTNQVEIDRTDIDKNLAPLLKNRDFYKELRLRGYHYSGLFRSITEARSDGLYGKVKWDNNWVAFLDCLLQISILGKDTRSLALPTSIQKLSINPKMHLDAIKSFGDEKEAIFEVLSCSELKTIRCSGIEIVNLQVNIVGRRKPPGIPVLESYKFIPYHETSIMKTSEAVRTFVQLALENFPTNKVKAVEIDGMRESILEDIHKSVDDLPLVTSELLFLTSRSLEENDFEYSIKNEKLSSHKGCYVVICSNIIHDKKFFENVTSSLGSKGFVICRENHKVQLNTLECSSNFTLISSVKLDDETLYLLKYLKEPSSQKSSTVIKITEKDLKFSWIEEVKHLMKSTHLVLVSQNEPYSGIIGLVNCLRKEPDGSDISCVFIDNIKAPKFDITDKFYQQQLKLELAINVFRNGKWGSYRHLLIDQENQERRVLEHCYVNSLVKSDLSSLKWISGPFNYSEPSGELLRVQFASLNFKDVMLATGKLSSEVFIENRIEQECILGFEFSGFTKNNRRVMGMVTSAALATHIEIDENFLWNCPDNWTLEEAATVPVVYGTVYSAFFLVIQIASGKKILIHAGSGGVGLAAIRVAFAYGLEVFTTVSTEEKKRFLLDEFPQLKEENIGNSRDTSFEKMILRKTKGKGVDYVLNSLADDKLQASIRCLGIGGKFLEIGKFDMANDTKIGLGNFLNELSFHAVMLEKLFNASKKDKLILRKLLDRDLKSGIIKPLKANIFEANEVEKAFRYLASGKHVGKVILKVRENESDLATLPISVLPRVYCSPNLTYIIPGGLGGFGLELADWLVLRGCRKLVLSSSRGITKQYQAYRIKIWESYGVKVAVNTSDISTKSGCEQLIRESMKLGPVGGIFNLAVILKDGIFENQDAEKFIECMAPKAVATKHLDEISRQLCPDLHYFVIFSSVSCGRGNAGQSNYGMANSVMERIIEHRHALGLPAKAIQWGAVGEVGLVADMQEDKLDMEIGGTLQQRISSCLEELDPLMATSDPLVSSMVVAEKRYASGGKGNILDAVMNIMGVRDIKSVSLETTLTELGMDSLMAVELKQIFERDYDISLSTQELRALSFMKIMEFSKESEDSENKKIFEVEENDDIFKRMLRYFGDETYSDQTILCLSSEKTFDESSCLGLLIPGIEGMGGHLLYKILKEVDFPISLLQLKKTSLSTSFSEIVELIKEDVLLYYKGRKTFHLIAHSFGSCIALMLIELLESKGMTGHVTMIDGSPLLMKRLLHDQYKDKTDEGIENTISHNIFSIGFTNLEDEALKKISTVSRWDEKIKILAQFKGVDKLYSNEYVNVMMRGLINRIKIILNLDIKSFGTYTATAALIRSTISTVANIDDKYDLQNNFEKNVDLLFLEGTHFEILESQSLIDILNKFNSLIVNE